MTTLLLFAILFICGFLNSYLFLFSPSTLFAWICSLLPLTPTATQTKPTYKANKREEKERVKEEEEEGVRKVAVNKVDIKSVFATFDHDHDGFITTTELEESFKRLGIFTSSREVMHIVSKVDANHDGLIDLEEFRKIYDSVAVEGDVKSSSGEKGGGEEEMDLKEAFDVFDGNGDGVISAEELGLVLSSLGLRQGGRVEDCHDMIRKVDEDGDGMVNFEEFKKMMVVKGN